MTKAKRKPFQRGSLGSARLLPGGEYPPLLVKYANPIKRPRDLGRIGLAVHAENLAIFLPRILKRTHQVTWSAVLARTIVALTVMEFICRGDPDFGYTSEVFKAFLRDNRFGSKDWVQDYVFGTFSGRGGKYLVDVWPQGGKGPRRVKRPRRIPKVPDYANGFVPDRKSPEYLRFKARWKGAGVVRMLGMGPMNPDWMRGAPGQHWLGVYPDIWDRVFASVQENEEARKDCPRPINVGGYPNFLKRFRKYRRRKWWGLWLPRTEWKIPAWAGFSELTRLPTRTKVDWTPTRGHCMSEGSGRRKPVEQVGAVKDGELAIRDAPTYLERVVVQNVLGWGREIDWARWLYNGWHTFDGAVEAVQGCADLRVAEHFATHPFVKGVTGGPGSPLRDPRGKTGERGNYIDVVETEAPWVYVRFTREYKRWLFNDFIERKENWMKEIGYGASGLQKSVRKLVEPFIKEAESMTEREKHTHIMTLGDGGGSYCKNIGELHMTCEDAYLAAFPDRSNNPATVKGAASRLLRDERIALGIAIYCLARADVVRTAAEVKFSDLYSRGMEVFQACMDTNNHKEAMMALKFIAEISGHLGNKGKGGVSVNILNNQTAQTPTAAEGGSVVSLPPSREQKAKDRIKQLTSIMDTRSTAMDWVNTNNLQLEEMELVEDDD